MIHVTRSSKPKILEKKSAGWTTKLLSATTKKARDLAAGKYRHEAVKSALENLFHGKCAYCESRIKHVAYGHIEHFRPKDTFQNYTFEWTNLLLSCPMCNGADHKWNHFPDHSAGGPIIDPCVDQPDVHFDFIFDEIAREAIVVGKSVRGKTTEALLGLNRYDLRTHRSNFVLKLYALSIYAETDPLAQELLSDARLSNAEYSAFARTLFA